MRNMAGVGNSTLLSTDTGVPFNRDACVVIVRTEWNANIVDALQTGCLISLKEAGLNNILIITVPGAIEIPFAIQRYWDLKKDRDRSPGAFIALACVIRGDTPHFEYVCQSVTEGILQLNLRLPVPVIFGVLTVDTEQQATDRVGGPDGHKGVEAAITTIKMMQLNESFKKQ